MLVVRLQGAVAAVDAACTRLGGEAIPAEAAQAFWAGLREQTDEFFAAAQRAIDADPTQRLWRLALPQTVAAFGPQAGEQLVEWGGAQRWLCTDASAAELRAAAVAAGGHATIFRARDKSPGVFTPPAAPLPRIQRELLRAFDPDAVFDAGRLSPA